MAPTRTRKRKSEQASSSPDRSPIKKRKMGLSLAQKQALIENLQLEITERARRLRAQYNVQAQQLRSRVEMRINRIPTALRKLKMGDLLAKHSDTQQPQPPRSEYVAKPPPVPAKDGASPKPIPRKPVSSNTQRNQKRLSNAINDTDDKENSVEPVGNPKKKMRGGPAAAETARILQGHILSPTSTNARVAPRGMERPVPPAKNLPERPFSPTKSMIARPASPIKGLGTKSSSNLLSNMVQKAKATRGAAAAAAGIRKATTSTTTSSSAGTIPRSRKPAVPSTSTSSSSSSSRGRRKVSQTSESSEASTGTVVKKTTTRPASRTAAAKSAPAAKRTVMNTIKSATTKKAPATKAAAAPATTGRTLRKRQA